MNKRTLIGLGPVALIAVTLVFSACEKTDESPVEVAEPEVDVSEEIDLDTSFDINFDPNVARDSTCNNSGCTIKKKIQAFVVPVCAVNVAGAVQAAGQRGNQSRAAASLADTACAPFACPAPNPCTTAGQSCIEQPATGSATTVGAPACVNTTQQGNCAAPQTTWNCTYATANVTGSKKCKCT